MSTPPTPPTPAPPRNWQVSHGFAVVRGDVVAVDIGFGEHYYVIVSNNARNAAGGTFLGVRLTSLSTYAGAPTVTQLSAEDGRLCTTPRGAPMSGWVLSDRITEIPPPPAYLPAGARSPRLSHLGRLSPTTMLGVDAALRLAIF